MSQKRVLRNVSQQVSRDSSMSIKAASSDRFELLLFSEINYVDYYNLPFFYFEVIFISSGLVKDI